MNVYEYVFLKEVRKRNINLQENVENLSHQLEEIWMELSLNPSFIDKLLIFFYVKIDFGKVANFLKSKSGLKSKSMLFPTQSK